MGKKNKKRVIISIFLILICMSLTGCTKDKEARQEADSDMAGEMPAWQKYAGEPVTFDWYINYSWFTTGWGENIVSRKITEETGVNIRFITPSGNENEKLNTLIAADSLPDFITLGWWGGGSQ